MMAGNETDYTDHLIQARKFLEQEHLNLLINQKRFSEARNAIALAQHQLALAGEAITTLEINNAKRL